MTESRDALAPWEVVRRARAADRPGAALYLESSFDCFIELHGDSRYRDDAAIRGGIAWLAGRPVCVIGQERGGSYDEQMRRNFGMPFPEGYYKASRLMGLAARFRLPVITLVDTPGAYPGLGAEERGQAGAIARLLECMARIEVPTIAVVIGQGGSGGALALALADRVLMLANAIYSVISPEGCAAILWHSAGHAPDAARALRMTASDLVAFEIVDEIIPEPAAGIGTRPREAALRVRRAVNRHLRQLVRLKPGALVAARTARYRRIGVFHDPDAALTRRGDGAG